MSCTRPNLHLLHINTHRCANRWTRAEKQAVAPGLQQAAAVIEGGANWLSVGELLGPVHDLETCS